MTKYIFCTGGVVSSVGKGVTAASKIADRTELEAVCLTLLETFRQPVPPVRPEPSRPRWCAP